MNETTIPATVVIFGASGDLTRRRLGPALHRLACEGLLHPATQVLGVARSPLGDTDFRARLYTGVEDYARLKPEVCHLWEDAAEHYTYLDGDYDAPETYQRLGERPAHLDATAGTAHNRLFYRATPPELYSVITHRLGEAGLNHSDPGWTRIIIEKPFGRDRAGARDLNAPPLATYTPGTWGPAEADALLAREGRVWVTGCGDTRDLIIQS